MITVIHRRLLRVALLPALLLGAPRSPAGAVEPPPAAATAPAADAAPDTTGQPEPVEETPAERAERLKKQAEEDKSNVEFESQRRTLSKSADAAEKLIDQLVALVKKSPADFDLNFKLANAYHEGGYLHSALAQYNEAVRVDSTQSKGWVNRGVVLKELGRMEDATESFRRAIAVNAGDALAHVNLGDMLLTQKKYPEAVDAYRRALVLDPSSPNVYYSLAIAFAESGMYRDAGRAWRQSAELAEARGTPLDKSNAEHAIANAKLMDEIVADAATELESREQKRQELERAGKEGGAKEGGGKESGAKKGGTKKGAAKDGGSEQSGSEAGRP